MINFGNIPVPSVLYDNDDSVFLYVLKKEKEKLWLFIIGMSKNMDDLTKVDRTEWEMQHAHDSELITKAPATKAVFRDIFE